jgi:hypothetical protein
MASQLRVPLTDPDVDFMPLTDPDVDFILKNADRLLTLAFRCVVSFGLSDGLNERLLATPTDRRDDWHQAIAGFHRDTLLMAVLRVAILLDKNRRVVSFQKVYDCLEKPGAREGLLQTLEERHGPDVFSPSRTEQIEEFRQTFKAIDPQAYARLKSLRNHGIAHLTPEQMFESVTLAEIRTMVGIISQLATTLHSLCPSQIAFRADILDKYRDLARKAIKKASA